MSTDQDIWRNGAKVTNAARLMRRANEFAFFRSIPEKKRTKPNPDALALAQAHPNKGWARRWLRERGRPFHV